MRAGSADVTTTTASEQTISTDLESGRATTEDPARTASAPRRVRTALVLAAGLVVGLAAAILVPRILGGDDPDPITVTQPTRVLSDDDVVDSPEDLLPDDVPLPAGAGAATPEAAVRGFLDAEAAQDLETSFGFLSAEERTIYGTPTGWISAHADVIPPVTGYRLGEVTEGPDGTTLAGTVTFSPSLDQVVGLVPAEAEVTWLVVLGPDDAWGVSVENSAFEPLYPSDDGVAPAAQAWVAARRSCEQPENEFPGLLGPAPLVTSLCDAAGEVDVAEPEALDSATDTEISTAFGDETAEAARLVRLTGGAELGIVLVPLGDEWTVIAVVP